MEKSSKNYISLFGEMPARGIPKPPPTSPRRESAEFTRGKNAILGRGREIQTRNWDAERGGGEITQNLITHQRINISTPDFKRR
jgi:hypothetical protein